MRNARPRTHVGEDARNAAVVQRQHPVQALELVLAHVAVADHLRLHRQPRQLRGLRRLGRHQRLRAGKGGATRGGRSRARARAAPRLATRRARTSSSSFSVTRWLARLPPPAALPPAAAAAGAAAAAADDDELELAPAPAPASAARSAAAVSSVYVVKSSA